MPEDSQDRTLPVLVEPYRTVETLRPLAPIQEPEAGPAPLPLSHYLWILRRQRWKILAFIAASVLATLIVSSRMQPIYEARTTIDVDRQTPTGVIGQDSMRTANNDADQFLATQVRLIQSDSVLRKVSEKYKLLELENGPAVTEKDRAKADRAAGAPVTLKNLKVDSPRRTFLILISYRSPDPQLAADVSNAVAVSYLEHTFDIRFKSTAGLSVFMEKQLEELKAKVERSSAALAKFEQELNVINPEQKTSIVSARLLQLNSEYTLAEADRVKKEAANQSVMTGTLEAAQVSTQGEALRKLSERADEAEAHYSEVKSHYGASHPENKKALGQWNEATRQLEQAKQNIGKRINVEYQEAVNREGMLEKAVAQQKKEFDHLNARSFEYTNAKREAEADKNLYEELVRKIKEASINSSFQNNSIRIADPARPPAIPVFPSIPLNLLVAFAAALLLACGAAVLADLLDNTLRDPEQVMRTLSTVVLGSLPVVKNWRGRLPSGVGGAEVVSMRDGAEQEANNYDEAIRTLRNSILLTDFDRRLRSLLITSASPAEGKSTIALRLAMAHASQHRKTLLIDGDLRRPSLHRKLGIPAGAGLSSVLLGETTWTDALVKIDAYPELDVLTAGPISRRSSELLEKRLVQILEEASRVYDLVILDAPPMLGFAEPLHMAIAADGVVVVGRAGQTSRKAVASVLSVLARLRANVVGIVLNEVNKEMSDSYYYYGHYGKYYRPTEAEA